MRWLKSNRAPSPPTKKSEKRVKVSTKLKFEARNYGIATAVDSREGLQLLEMDDFAQRMFAASNAEVRKRKGVGLGVSLGGPDSPTTETAHC